VATLGCGQTISSANNAGGASQSHSLYGCGTSASSGPEIAYAFTTAVDEPVTIGLTGLGADLDMFLLNSPACDGSGAIACSTNPDGSDEWISFNATAGAVYTIVVDGWEGATSGFNLSAQCTGGTTPVDTSPPDESIPDDSVVPTTDDSAPVAEWTGLPGDRVPLGGLGCGATDEGGGGNQEGDGLPGTPTRLSELGCRGGAGAALIFVAASGLRRRKRGGG
jgi:hypothetical protein